MLGFNVENILQGVGAVTGLLLIGGIVFAESGLLIGFFLPGDTLLFTAGFFSAQGKLPLGWLIVVVVLAAIIGDSVGYNIGHRTGRRIFRKKDGIFFRQEHIARAEKFYEAHGGKTIIIARFVPIVRTFAPLVAGVGKMSYRRFLAFNVIGGVIWGSGIVLLGHWLGSRIPNIDRYILPAVLVATIFTFSPMVLHILRDEEAKQKIALRLKAWWRRLSRRRR